MKDLTKFEKVFYGTSAVFMASFVVLQLLRYFGIIAVGPYLK